LKLLVAVSSSLAFLVPHCSGTYEYYKFSELTSIADHKSFGSCFGSGSGLKLVSDPDRIQIRINADPDPGFNHKRIRILVKPLQKDEFFNIKVYIYKKDSKSKHCCSKTGTLGKFFVPGSGPTYQQRSGSMRVQIRGSGPAPKCLR